MKPNGKMLVVRAVLFAVCAVGMFSRVSKAETVHGTFKLPVETRWGKMVLAPGEYEFALDTESSASVITIRSRDSGWSGMVLSESLSDIGPVAGESLVLAKYEQGMYVQKLNLKDAGFAMNFAAPKTRMSKLAKSTLPSSASAAGMH